MDQREEDSAALLREMPTDFSPEISVQDNDKGRLVVGWARARFPSGKSAYISLGFQKTNDQKKDGKLMVCLRQAVWQAVELARLGREDELKNLIGGLC